ncbi:MAG: tetratricopeptide repeat protein [Isosphaeraceae bacterium]|nr:tetratricopeptide repeat protein [Isosphaeraceae bacterium]
MVLEKLPLSGGGSGSLVDALRSPLPQPDALNEHRVRLNAARDERRLGPQGFAAAEDALVALRRFLQYDPKAQANAAADARELGRRGALIAAIHVELGRLQELQGRRDEGLEQFQQAIRRFESVGQDYLNAQGQDHTDFGIALDRTGDSRAREWLERGEERLHAAVNAAGDDLVPIITLAENLEAQKRNDAAADLFAIAAYALAFTRRLDLAEALAGRALELNPKGASILAVKGEVFHRAGRPQDALDALNKALTLDRSFARAGLLIKAELQQDLRDYRGALDTLERIKPEDADDTGRWLELAAELHAALGDQETAQGNRERAQAEYESALQVLERLETFRPGDPRTGALAGRALLALGRFEEARLKLQEASKSSSYVPWARVAFVEALIRLGRLAEARAATEAFLNETPDDPELIGKHGRLLRSEGNITLAIERLQRAVELNPNLAWAHAELSEALRCADRLVEALQAADRALQLDKRNAWVWRIKGATLNGLNRPAAALEAFDQSLALEPDNSWALALKGSVLSDLACYEQAIALFEQSTLPAGAARAWVLGLRGWANETLGERCAEKASAAYSEALKNEPENPIWKIGLANTTYLVDCALDQPQSSASYRELTQQIEADDNDADLLSQLGWCYFRLGDLKRAEELLCKALEIDDELISTRFDYGLALLCAGDSDAACREYERSQGFLDSPEVVRRRDLIHVALEDLRQAVRHRVILADHRGLSKILAVLRSAFERTLNLKGVPNPAPTAALRFAANPAMFEGE